jgi:hypothetical protein
MSDAPRSFSASIITRLTPTAIAGRASGSATRKKLAARPAPSVRETSITQADCIRNIARVAR